MTKVVNKNVEEYDIYIGRKKQGMHFGNPFSHLDGVPNTIKVKTRDEAVNCFKLWITGHGFRNVEPDRREWILANLEKLRGKRLGCFCSPLLCHGNIYAELLNDERY